MPSHHSNRHYKEQGYQTTLGGFSLAGVFIFVGVLALIFRAIKVEFIGLRYWGYWLFIPAFFIILGSIHQLYVNKKYQKVLLNSLSQRDYSGTHKIEDIAAEIGLKPNDVIRILLDLRNKGKVKYRFNSESGELILGESIPYVPSSEYAPSGKKIAETPHSRDKNFCPYCGQELKPHATYCPHCGSQLE
ncbi:MAG: zinc-ribbon domain-containing protein [Promethearchaeota archaeon]|nr:MAG: zinc-ribbon domain-containing protein [Candidatus Lokiarchaeota archaeon]